LSRLEQHDSNRIPVEDVRFLPFAPKPSEACAEAHRIVSIYFKDEIHSNSVGEEFSGHLTEGSLCKLFEAIGKTLHTQGQTWSEQHFIDLGMGEGFVFYSAALMGCRYVSGIDVNVEALKRCYTVAVQSREMKQKISQWGTSSPILTWGLVDILHLTPQDLKGTSLVYAFSQAFPPLVTWHIICLFRDTPSIRLLALAKRSVGEALEMIQAKPTRYEKTILEDGDKELAVALSLARTQKRFYRVEHLRMSGSSETTPFDLFTRQDLFGTDEATREDTSLIPISVKQLYPLWWRLNLLESRVAELTEAARDVRDTRLAEEKKAEEKDEEDEEDEEDEAFTSQLAFAIRSQKQRRKWEAQKRQEANNARALRLRNRKKKRIP
jgi:hypothetical protein